MRKHQLSSSEMLMLYRYVRNHTKSSPMCEPQQGAQQAAAIATSTLPPVSTSNSNQAVPTKIGVETGKESNSDCAGYALQPVPSTGSNETAQSPTEGSEMLYARLSELHLSQWQSQLPIVKRTVYLSESFVLSYIVQEVAGPGSDGSSPPSTQLQYPVPPTVDDRASNLGYDTRLEPEEIRMLEWRGAFSVPEKSISDRLIRTYFDCVHPAFPIWDRVEFAASYQANRLSLLTLHTVYLLASTLCDESLIIDAGFADRSAARKAFYGRAKALYDADYETDTLTVISALLLISFCWGGPMDQKDMWHWLGAAIGLAQTQGMHRSYVYPRI